MGKKLEDFLQQKQIQEIDNKPNKRAIGRKYIKEELNDIRNLKRRRRKHKKNKSKICEVKQLTNDYMNKSKMIEHFMRYKHRLSEKCAKKLRRST